MRSSDLALVALLVVVAALAIGSVRMDSATADEPAHIANGMVKLQERWLNFFREQPPLMNSLSALPLVASGYRMPTGWKGADHWVAGRRFLYRSGYDAHRILFLARLPTIALFLALVAVVYWFVLMQTASGWWALAAAALTAFCPNVMAHGRLATVDLALTFFAFAAGAFFIALIEHPRPLIAVALGLATAAALMSKISGLILGPYFVIVLLVALMRRDSKFETRDSTPHRISNLGSRISHLALAALVAIVFFEAFTLAETGAAFAREQYPSTPRLLIPFAEYMANIQTIRAWYSRGHQWPQFLMGEFSLDGWPHYYLVAFLLKTTIPAILLLIAALVAGARKRSFAFVAMIAFVVLFLLFAAFGKLALGVRYVLPIYPFLYAAIAIALSTSNLKRAGVALVIAMISWHAVENVVAYPSYIAYFNELTGGRANADKFLIDSNLDWGQDLRRLDAWCRANGVSQITVHYFGGGDVAYEMRAARPLIRYAPEPEGLPKGWFALSRHFYRLSFFLPLWHIDYDDYLAASHARYVTTIGGSINVYRVE